MSRAGEGVGQLDKIGRLGIDPDFGDVAFDHAVANHRIAMVVPDDYRDG